MHFQPGIMGRDFDGHLKKIIIISAGNRENTTFTQLKSPVLDLIIKNRAQIPKERNAVFTRHLKHKRLKTAEHVYLYD